MPKVRKAPTKKPATKKPAAPKKYPAKKPAPKKPAPKKSVTKTPAKKPAPTKKTSTSGRGRPTLPAIDRPSLVATQMKKISKQLGAESTADLATKLDLRLTQATKLVDSAYHGTTVALLEQIADKLGKKLSITFR